MKTNCRSSILLHKGEDYLLITVNRAELLATVKRATTIAPPDSPLDVLKGVLLESDSARKMLTVTSTNLEVALVEKIPCSAQEDGALVYSARTLAEMLQRLPEDTVEISRKENRGRMTLTSGSVSYEVDVWDRGAFPKPDLPFPEDTVKVSGIPAVAQHTVFATAQDKDKPLLRCVNLMFTDAGLRAAGSNGMCIVTAKGDDQSTGDTRLAVLKNKQNGAFGQVSTTITLEELIEMQREVAAIPVPDSANELTDDILCELRKSMAVSDRKYLGYYPIAQARAWLSGHDKVEPSDLLALKDYLWRLPADREKVESVLNRFCINPMQEKVNDVREMALDSQAGFEEACGDGSRADLARKAFIKLRGELVRLYQKQCELRTSAQSDSETALMDGLLNDLEDISRRAHEKTGFTYTPLSEIAALN